MNNLLWFLDSSVFGYRPNPQHLKKLTYHNKMSENYEHMSFMFKVKIEQEKGSFEFPSQLRQDLFQNFVRIRGLYSAKTHKEYVFVLSNLSEHGRHKSVIRNILGTFNFGWPKTFKPNYMGDAKLPVNIIPSQMTFFISNASFETVDTFSGWLLVEIIGEKRKNIE